MKNKRMNFTPSKKVAGMLSPIQADKEFKAMLTDRPGRPVGMNRMNGLAQPKEKMYPKYIMRDGIPHKIVGDKWVPLTLKAA
jgi:hypothetical protein